MSKTRSPSPKEPRSDHHGLSQLPRGRRSGKLPPTFGVGIKCIAPAHCYDRFIRSTIRGSFRTGSIVGVGTNRHERDGLWLIGQTDCFRPTTAVRNAPFVLAPIP